MKRRTLLKGLLYASPLTIKVGDVFAKDDEIVIGEDVLSSYDPISDDITEFNININRMNRSINITPRNDEKPFLSVLSLHRHLHALADDSTDNVIDITDASPSARLTDSYIILENGWTLTSASASHLYGAVTYGASAQYSVKLLGKMDPSLTKNLYIVDDNGNKFYQHMGVFNVVTTKQKQYGTVTLKYLSYRNLHYDHKEARRNGWVENTLTITAGGGVAFVPISSVGY